MFKDRRPVPIRIDTIQAPPHLVGLGYSNITAPVDSSGTSIYKSHSRSTETFFTLLKDLSDSSMYDMESWFGPEIGDLTSQDQTDLWSLMTRAGQVGDWVSFSVDNMSAAEREQAQGGDYMVWESAEMESTCDFCAPLDNKIISMDDVL